MTALVTATEPGPWRSRTHELGTFLGVHIDGRLVAMAGQRMRLDRAVEISAVCTHPDYRGRGLARALTSLAAHRIAAIGCTPFLHVRADNVAAVRAYEAAGFTRRVTLNPGAYEVAA
jgi:predicted GNAT family acetyltransferase